jgi:polysaccharide biosynthesis transport protein
MPRPAKSRRQPVHTDDFDDDGFEDDFSREIGQERLKQLLSDLIGRWHWIALGLVLGVLGGFYYLSKAPEVYEAKSIILVKERTTSVMTKEQDAEIDMKSSEALNTVAQRISRPELLEKVAARKDIQELPGVIPEKVNWLPEWANRLLGDHSSKSEKDILAQREPERLARSISDWLSVSVQRNTRLLNVSIAHPSPHAAKALADAIAEEYEIESVASRSEGRSSSVGILIKESDQARNRLQVAQNSLSNYQRAIATLKELELKEAAALELGRRYLPKHPKMASATSELIAYQERFLSEFEAARNSPADKDYWAQNAAELQQVAGDPAAKLQVARRLLLSRSTVLESEITSQNNVFNSILTRIEESDINQQGAESEMELSSAALLPSAPSSPKKPLVLGASAIAGLGLGGFLALLLVRLDNKFHTVSQAERETGLPTLAAISNISPKILDQIARKKKVDPNSLSPAQKKWDQRLVFREGTSNSTFAEMFRVLRASVSLLGDEKQRRITLFSSALPGEGKTFVSCNFALAAAQQGKRTLLIDLDLRKPSVHKMFGLQRDSHPKGSTEVLSGQSTFDEAIFTETGEEHLHIMLSGKRAPNPGELLSASKLAEFLKMATDKYDLVILDSAPLLAVPDTRIIAPLADNFCLVTRAEYVPKGAVRRVISLLQADNNLPVGIIFNGFEEKKRLIGQNYSYGNYQTNRYGRAYRYGYGAYGAYGSEDE